MKPSDILHQAQDLIATPDHWCRDTFARDQEGRQVDPTGHFAFSWCMTGAVRCIASRSNEGIDLMHHALSYLYRVCSIGAAIINDHPGTTHNHVLALLHRAEDLAKQEGN